jgi:hypothetical protein
MDGFFTGNIGGYFPWFNGANGLQTLWATDGTNTMVVHSQLPSATTQMQTPTTGGTYVVALPMYTDSGKRILSGEFQVSFVGPNLLEQWDVKVWAQSYDTTAKYTVLQHGLYGSPSLTLEVVADNTAGSQITNELAVIVANTGNTGILYVNWIGDGLADQLILPTGATPLANVIPFSYNPVPNGTTATTQTAGDNSTKVATTAYVATPGAISPSSVTINGGASSTTVHQEQFVTVSGSPLCSASAGVGNSCAFSVTWPNAFPDANYGFECYGAYLNTGFIVGENSKTATSASVSYINLTTSVGVVNKAYCRAWE